MENNGWVKAKEGNLINRIDCEFYCDTDEIVKQIPKTEYKPFSRALAINEGNVAMWIADSKKEWYKCG